MMCYKTTLFYLYFHLMDFIFVFDNPSIFILTHSKIGTLLRGHVSGLDKSDLSKSKIEAYKLALPFLPHD